MIDNTLCLSTSHITKQTAELLEADALDIMIIGAFVGGFMLWSDYGDEKIPDDLRIVLDLAQKMECRFVYFDWDEDEIPELPTYEEE